MRRWCTALVVLVAVVASTPSPASAQRGHPPAMAGARAAYAEGLKEYDLGHFDTAIARFLESFQISDAPGLLFNIAQAQRGKKDHAQALHFYRAFLRRVPHAPNRADVETFITEVEKEAEAARQAKEREQDKERAARLDAERRAEVQRLAEIERRAAVERATALRLEEERLRLRLDPTLVVKSVPSAGPTPTYRRWWPWTIGLGAVVAGVVVAALAISFGGPELPPAGRLGTIDAR